MLALHPEPGLHLGGLLGEEGGLLLEGADHALVGGGAAGAGRTGAHHIGEGDDGDGAKEGEDCGDDHAKSVRRGCDSGRGPRHTPRSEHL